VAAKRGGSPVVLRWRDDSSEVGRALRLAYTTSGPLVSHRDVKKGRRECPAVAH
jgi:hypothetical protein